MRASCQFLSCRQAMCRAGRSLAAVPRIFPPLKRKCLTSCWTSSRPSVGRPMRRFSLLSLLSLNPYPSFATLFAVGLWRCPRAIYGRLLKMCCSASRLIFCVTWLLVHHVPVTQLPPFGRWFDRFLGNRVLLGFRGWSCWGRPVLLLPGCWSRRVEGGAPRLSICRPRLTWILRVLGFACQSPLATPAPCGIFPLAPCVLCGSTSSGLACASVGFPWSFDSLVQAGAAIWICATFLLFRAILRSGCFFPDRQPALPSLFVSPLEFSCIRRVRDLDTRPSERKK